MDNFIHRGKEVVSWQVTGEILGSSKYSETHVSSSGGGGHVGQHGGYVSAPKVHSSTVTNHEFWIKTDNGFEQPVKLRGVDIPLRPGQKVTLISSGRKEKDNGYYSILVNHNAGRHWFLMEPKELMEKLELEKFSILSYVKILIPVAIIIWYFNLRPYEQNLIFSEIVFFSAVLFLIYKFVTRLRRISKLTQKLKQHLENLAQLTYQNY